jgi:quercetin dioxygenase-like cupin family protein
MTRSRALRWVGYAFGVLLIGAPALSAQAVEPDADGFLVAQPADLAAAGGRQQLIVGNPRESGLYVLRITFPPGSGSRPHYHDQARYITVIKGTWWVSTGAASDVYDPDHMKRVEEGSFIYEPPNGHHYDMAKDEEVIVQIMGMGPVTTTQIPQEGDAEARSQR